MTACPTSTDRQLERPAEDLYVLPDILQTVFVIVVDVQQLSGVCSISSVWSGKHYLLCQEVRCFMYCRNAIAE